MTAAILRLDVSGRPNGWVSPEVAAHAYTTDSVVWGLGEHDIVLHGGIQQKTGQRSILAMQPVIAVKGRVVSDFVPALTNELLFRRDEHVCLYCGNQFHRKLLTRDHIHPTSRGGKDVWRNVATACKRCNQAKDDRLLSELGWDLLAVPFEPNLYEWHYLAKDRIRGVAFDYLAEHFKNLRDRAA